MIANKIPWRDDAAALVIGPTGVALAATARCISPTRSTAASRPFPNAMTRTSAVPDGGQHRLAGGLLNQPLGLTLAPNGNILTTNAGDGNIVETTPAGKQVTAQTADTKTGAGSLFGMVIAPEGKGIYYIDDGENTLRLLHSLELSVLDAGGTGGSKSAERNANRNESVDRNASARGTKIRIVELRDSTGPERR